MPGTIVTDVLRPDEDAVAALQGYGVAAVHEAMGRFGNLGAALRPIQQGAITGRAVTALVHRGVRGLVIDANIRDTATLRTTGFPAWSRHVSAEGTVKATTGHFDLPVVVAGQTITQEAR